MKNHHEVKKTLGFVVPGIYEGITGFLIVLFFFSGRWHLGRLSNTVSGGIVNIDLQDFINPLFVPRVWVALAMIIWLAVTIHLKNTNKGEYSYNRYIKSLSNTIIAFLFAYMCTAFWSRSLEYSLPKLYELSTLFIAAIFTAQICKVIPGERVRYAFWFFIVIIAGIFAINAITNLSSFISSGYYQIRVFGGGKNTFGRNVALLMMASLYFLRYKDKSKLWYLVWYFVLVISFALVVISGGRGATIGSVVALVIYLAIEKYSMVKKMKITIISIIVLITIIYYSPIGKYFILNMQVRILDQTLEKHHLAGREDIWQTGYDIAMLNPVYGSGLAAYTYYTKTNYPHNFILEMFIEGGFIYLALFVSIILLLILHIIKHRRIIDNISVATLILLFITHQTSGDIYDARVIFVMMILTLIPKDESPETGKINS